MAGVVFFFEDNDKDVYSGRRIDLDAWKYAVHAAGDIDTMYVINRTDADIITPDHNLKFQVFKEYPELKGHVTKVVCPWEKPTDTLWNYNHKTDWYLFGPASGWEGFDLKLKPDACLTIPMHGVGALHSMHVSNAVFLHRYGVLNNGRKSRK